MAACWCSEERGRGGAVGVGGGGMTRKRVHLTEGICAFASNSIETVHQVLNGTSSAIAVVLNLCARRTCLLLLHCPVFAQNESRNRRFVALNGRLQITAQAW